MGIPGFYRWLIKNINPKIRDINITSIPTEQLFIDSNTFIYKAIDEVDTNITENIDELIINQIISDIKDLINNFNPSKLLYISFDGMAPFAKIIEQRKNIYEWAIDTTLIESYINSPFNKLNWDLNNITLGSIFSKKLNNTFDNFIKNSEFVKILKEKNPELKVIFSGINESGEGEHKIINFIKNQKSNNKKYIYSPDADIIILTMIQPNSNIFIIHDSLDVENTYNLIDITDIKRRFIGFIFKNKLINQENMFYCKDHNLYNHIQNIINDLAFIMIFFGNDFLFTPQLLGIKDDLEGVIRLYINELIYFNKKNDKIKFLINNIQPTNIQVNNKLFKFILNELAIYEKGIYNNKYFVDSLVQVAENNNIKINKLKMALIDIINTFKVSLTSEQLNKLEKFLIIPDKLPELKTLDRLPKYKQEIKIDMIKDLTEDQVLILKNISEKKSEYINYLYSHSNSLDERKYIDTFGNYKNKTNLELINEIYGKSLQNKTKSKAPLIKINDICQNYLETMMWIFYYYFYPKSFGLTKFWAYKYEFTPFINDLNKFMQSSNFDMNSFKTVNNIMFKTIDKNNELTIDQIMLFRVPPEIMKNINNPLYEKNKNNEEYINIHNIKEFKHIYYGYAAVQLFNNKLVLNSVDYTNLLKLKQ